MEDEEWGKEREEGYHGSEQSTGFRGPYEIHDYDFILMPLGPVGKPFAAVLAGTGKTKSKIWGKVIDSYPTYP